MSKQKFKIYISIVTILGVAILYFWANNVSLTNNTYSVYPTKTANKNGKYVKPKDFFSNETIKKLSDIINNRSNTTTSLSVIDLSTEQNINIGSEDEFSAASTTKLLSAVAYLKQVQDGQASLEKPINGQKPIDLIQQTLNQSDNDALAYIDNYTSYPKLEIYAHEIGITSYNWLRNSISAKDAAKFLEKMYNGQLVETKYINQILPFMQNTSENEFIPPALPSGAIAYNKAGYLDGNIHDIALIKYKDRVFAVAIYTNNNLSYQADWDSRVSFIHELVSTLFAK